jgi:hypothetical protein
VRCCVVSFVVAWARVPLLCASPLFVSGGSGERTIKIEVDGRVARVRDARRLRALLLLTSQRVVVRLDDLGLVVRAPLRRVVEQLQGEP